MYPLSWFCNTYIYDLCNDDRYDQVKYNLQKFKKWRKDAFFFVVF